MRFAVCLTAPIVMLSALQAGCMPGAPDANFTADERFGQAPLTVQFEDTSEPGDTPITAWSWTFGDGDTSTEQNPEHTYDAEGKFRVSLSVTNSVSMDSLARTGYIVVGNIWAAALEGPENDTGEAILEARDTTTEGEPDQPDILVLSTGATSEGDSQDILLDRLDARGNVLWTVAFGGGEEEAAAGLVETVTGDIVFVGTTRSFGAGGRDVYLVRTDPDGNELWAQTFGSGRNERGRAIVQAAQGGFLIAAEESGFDGQVRPQLIRVDSEGNEMWSSTLEVDVPVSASVTVTSLATAPENTAIIAGYFGFTSNQDLFVLKADADGNEVWERSFGDSNNQRANAVATVQGGEVLVAGASRTATVTGQDMLALRLDSDGNEIWSQQYGGTRLEEAFSVIPANGGFLLAGVTSSFGAGADDVYLVRIDGAGTEQWSTTRGGSEDDRAAAVAAAEGGFLVAGATASFGGAGTEVYVLRTDEDGNAPSAP